MKVIGVGDNVVDRYRNVRKMFPGGNAVNFSVYAKKCGADAAYLGVLADDPEGLLIKNALIALGVAIDGCSFPQGSGTERCDVELIDGDRTFVGSSIPDNRQHIPMRLQTEHLSYLETFDLIHCGCYAYMEDDIWKLASLTGLKTFDFSAEEEFRTEAYLEKICPHIDMALFSAEGMDENHISALQQKVYGLGCQYVLVTNGKKGQSLYDGQRYYSGTVKFITPVDTMGAGDSFFTCFVISLLKEGWKKGTYLPEYLISKAFASAAAFSADNCLIEGSFGFATAY